MYSAIAGIGFLLLSGYFLFKYYNTKKDKVFFKNLEIDLKILKNLYESKIKELETEHFGTVKEFIDKIEYLKKEIKRHLTTVREYEILLQELNDKETLALDRITIVKKEISDPIIVPVAVKASKKSKK